MNFGVLQMKKILLLFVLLWQGFSLSAQEVLPDTLQFTFKLHGQTRRFKVSFTENENTLRMDWTILRNLKWWVGSYTMSRASLQGATELCFLMPEDGNHVTIPAHQICYILPADVYRALKEKGEFVFNRTRYALSDSKETAFGVPLLHVKDQIETGEMWILDNPHFPLICRMANNPLEINWQVERL